MDFPSPLVGGRLIRRYKRFLADVLLDDGSEITAHVPNPGSMLGLAEAGRAVWLSRSASPKRKLPYSLELVEADGGLVGVNTQHPNRLAAEALVAGRIPELAGYRTIRPEVRYGGASRVDFLLEDPDRGRCWLEVKGVTLSRREGVAEWPDCPSVRAAKHLAELAELASRGERATVLFLAQRADCASFSIAADLDPMFARRLDAAQAAGVEVMVYGCAVSRIGVCVTQPIPWPGRKPRKDAVEALC